MSLRNETASDRYSAASGLASAIGVTAQQYGIDIGPICSALGIDTSSFNDLTGRISLDRLCRLMESCAVIANDETFGLKAAGNFRPGSTGPFGYGLMSAPTALDFFRFLADHRRYASEANYTKFVVDERGALNEWSFSPLIVKRDQFVDMGTALIMARLRPILGNAVDQVEVNLERPKPKNAALFREKLSRRVQFGRKINSLRLPSELFGRTNPNADPQLFKLMDLQCRSLHSGRSVQADFADDLKEYLLAHVADATISLREAADYFHLSERTLQRRLAENKTSLNELRDEVRRDLAERLLRDSDLTASEIAERVGYSAPSAFTRSTLRWFGKTPREFRKSLAPANKTAD